MKNNENDDQVWPPAPATQTIRPDAEKAQNVTTAKDLFQGRIFGLVMVAVGVGCCIWLRNVYYSGARFSEDMAVIPPMLLIVGIAFALEPRILFASIKGAPPQPAIFKIVGYVASGLGLAIGLFVRYVIFGAWHKVH